MSNHLDRNARRMAASLTATKEEEGLSAVARVFAKMWEHLQTWWTPVELDTMLREQIALQAAQSGQPARASLRTSVARVEALLEPPLRLCTVAQSTGIEPVARAQSPLVKRALAAPGWRWVDGMADQRGFRGSGADPDDPDFSDPGTLGCLRSLVRERHGCTCTTRHHDLNDDNFWEVLSPAERRLSTGTTEAEALVAALEVAP